MMNATITVRRSGGVIPAPGIRGAFGGTDSADTAEIVIDLSNDGDVEEMHISGLFDPAARALNIIGAAEEPEDEVEAEFAPEDESTPKPSFPEPAAGDAWALRFEDGSGSIYIFNGARFISPAYEGTELPRMATTYLPGAYPIVSARLVAAAADYDKAAGTF